MPLSDDAVDRLRQIVDAPDLGGTSYRILKELGRGGMGTVYLARDERLQREVALKILGLTAADPEISRRMLQEARILAQLEHPGIVPVHDVGTLPDGRVYYAMKRVRGKRLDEYRSNSASIADLLRIFQRICDAVAFAHGRGVIHRDLKPQNIMIGAYGEVLVLDWGVAKWVQPPRTLPLADGEAKTLPAPLGSTESPAARGPSEPQGTVHGTVLGTPGFMAPEQAHGQVDIDRRADVYALGAILYFLLNGPEDSRPTLAAETGEELPEQPFDPGTPKSLRMICRKAMQSDPARRYQDARELRQDVARFLDGLPVVAYQERLADKARRIFVKYRTPILLVMTYLAFRVLLLLV